MIAAFDIARAFQWLFEGVTFVAHLFTAVLGAFAIWGLVWHRNKIGAFVRVLAHGLIANRINKIRLTLGRLNSLNYDDKPSRREILAIIGELAGMLHAPATKHEGFRLVHEQLIALNLDPKKLTEPTKRRLAQELDALLEERAFVAAVTLMEEMNGPKNYSPH